MPLCVLPQLGLLELNRTATLTVNQDGGCGPHFFVWILSARLEKFFFMRLARGRACLEINIYIYIYIQAARPQGRKRLALIYKKETRPQAAIFFESMKAARPQVF